MLLKYMILDILVISLNFFRAVGLDWEFQLYWILLNLTWFLLGSSLFDAFLSRILWVQMNLFKPNLFSSSSNVINHSPILNISSPSFKITKSLNTSNPQTTVHARIWFSPLPCKLQNFKRFLCCIFYHFTSFFLLSSVFGIA